MISRLLLATLLATCATAAPGQQVYKWIDEKGVTQYSTTPPPGGKAQTIKTAPANSGAEPRMKSWKEQEVEFRARQVERAEAHHKENLTRQDVARHRAACASVQRDLRHLNEQRPVYTLNEKGERQYLDDAQRTEAARKSRTFIDRECVK